MKILSNISGVGKRLCRLIMAIVVVVCLNSCFDSWYFLAFNNDGHLRWIDVPTETGNVVIHCTCRGAGTYALWFDLKGEYVLNPDSLKLTINNEKKNAIPKMLLIGKPQRTSFM